VKIIWQVSGSIIETESIGEKSPFHSKRFISPVFEQPGTRPIAMFAIQAAKCIQLSFLLESHQVGGRTMGVSDPEIRKKLFGPRWQHEIEKQGWPLWKRLIHRLQRCPLCRPKAKTLDRKSQ